MRVVSDTSLLWCTQVKTAEEAKGLKDFVTCRRSTVANHSGNKPWFQSCCLYWIYPSMPWLRLFPRIVPDSKIRFTSVSLLDPDVNTELQNDWTESFSSVFHQLRSQKCSYFYVCTHQFTVLFRAAGIAGQSAINAFLTPTTRGFREALKKEGTPSSENGKEEDSGKQVEEKDDDKDEYDDEFLETDEGASVWLESIGLDKKYFPSLDPDKVKIQREGFKVIDNRPESLVYVQGGDVQGLFNYLLNCRSCVSTTGPLAGVPPTILAPVKHSIVRQKELDFRNKQMHILEIVGPILPHHIQRFSALFSHTQNNNYSFTFNTHEPTVPFNFDLPCINSDDSVEKEREKLDMQEDVHNSFFDVIEISDRLSSIKELHRSKEGYSWIT
ncbi:hypothetical protein FSP39_024959 [Pinctada imbricata]|uniref:Protein downstream neighbor of Son n=1 Tax=Pinctada imbricata TaxID=66713 RepID=A0AA89C857_PINIB|nr:hypothetical protein FSP39_024959 [Pinctada imbricata]